MAYNLQSLITIVEKILDPQQTRWIVDDNKPKLQSLLEKSVSLQQILEKSPLTKIESLENQIRDAAHEAEDMIESHMVDQMLSNPEAVSLTFSTPNLQNVMQQLDSAMEQVAKLVKGKTTSSGSSSSGSSFMSSKSVVVGVDEDLIQLKDRLVGMQRKLEIVPIVGMGGIGKTTLAQKIYEDEDVVSHFGYRGWATISEDYNIRAILLGLLRCIIEKEAEQHVDKQINELKDVLHKSLYGRRRYLIVIDDIWSTSSWDEIRKCFPNNNNGSRIVLTTRKSDVATHVDSQSLQHQVRLLSDTTSWDLLRQIVFGEEVCPDFLQGIGEKIARDCVGLPLAIIVIGGVLSKVDRSKDGWANIANNVASAIVESDKRFSNILSLSYNHLPIYLKPCFLYIGAFPEDYEIETSKLVLLWIAEGFVKSNGDKTLKEEAEDYLKVLVERNLLLVTRYKLRNGKPKRCSIHDLLRELCLRKAYEDKFLHVKNAPRVTFADLLISKCLFTREADDDSFPEFSNSRRMSVDASSGMEDVYSLVELMTPSLVLSFLVISTEIHEMTLSPFLSVLRLVRVLDVMDVRFDEFPAEILQLVNLRFLAINCCGGGGIPSGISRLWNLQTLIAVVGPGSMPFEIFKLPELRHLKLHEVMLFEDEHVKQIVQKKLQTISLVNLSRSLIRNGFLEGIPNIEDLEIGYYDDSQLSVVDLSHLDKLETLRCKSYSVRGSLGFWSTLKFPFALRKLTLSSIAIFPRVSTLLCTLPNLEVLEIRFCGFKREDEELKAVEEEALSEDEEWEEEESEEETLSEEEALSEDEEEDEELEEKADDEDEEWEVEGDKFRSLQHLTLGNLRLKRWRADETNFPKLRHLTLIACEELEEIPSGIGEIPTLQLMEVLRQLRPQTSYEVWTTCFIKIKQAKCKWRSKLSGLEVICLFFRWTQTETFASDITARPTHAHLIYLFFFVIILFLFGCEKLNSF